MSNYGEVWLGFSSLNKFTMIHIAFVMIGYWKSVIGDIKYQMMISLKRKFYHFLSGDDEVDDDAIEESC